MRDATRTLLSGVAVTAARWLANGTATPAAKTGGPRPAKLALLPPAPTKITVGIRIELTVTR